MRWVTDSKGLTLVELAVAILILSVGALAALRSLDISTNAAGGAEARTLARIAVLNRAEERRLYGMSPALPGNVTVGGQTIAITEDRAPTAGGLTRVTLLAQAPGTAGVQLVIFVPPGVPQ